MLHFPRSVNKTLRGCKPRIWQLSCRLLQVGLILFELPPFKTVGGRVSVLHHLLM